MLDQTRTGSQSTVAAHPRAHPRARRGAWLALAAAVGALGLGAGRATADDDDAVNAAHARAKDVVLVHGAFADGSSWSGVIERLQRDGYTVRALQLPLQSLAGDAAIVRAELDRIGRPVVLVGHSYGGAVISQAATGTRNVVALVYVAAYAPDDGESLGALNARFPTTPIGPALVVDPQGNATIDPEAFPRVFAPDVPVRQARVLAAAQKPISGAIFGTPGGRPAWRELPSWYQVSRDDQAIAPELERFMAARMHARTIELSSSHVSLISHPRAISELIEHAARGE